MGQRKNQAEGSSLPYFGPRPERNVCSASTHVMASVRLRLSIGPHDLALWSLTFRIRRSGTCTQAQALRVRHSRAHETQASWLRHTGTQAVAGALAWSKGRPCFCSTSMRVKASSRSSTNSSSSTLLHTSSSTRAHTEQAFTHTLDRCAITPAQELVEDIKRISANVQQFLTPHATGQGL